MKLLFDILTPDMDRSSFTCGDTALDTYVHKQAGQDMKRGFATVITAHDESSPYEITGFYTLSAASVLLTDLPEKTAHKMPRYPYVPAIRLGRLAVASSVQGRHIGSLLVLDALRRACHNELAWAVFLVDAKSMRSIRFYEKFLFQRFEDDPLKLWMHRKQAETTVRLLGQSG